MKECKFNILFLFKFEILFELGLLFAFAFNIETFCLNNKWIFCKSEGYCFLQDQIAAFFHEKGIQ